MSEDAESGGHGKMALVVAVVIAASVAAFFVIGLPALSSAPPTQNVAPSSGLTLTGTFNPLSGATFTLTGAGPNDQTAVEVVNGQTFCTGVGDITCDAPLSLFANTSCPTPVVGVDVTTGVVSAPVQIQAAPDC